MKRKQKRYYKKIVKEIQRQIWKMELSSAVIRSLTLNYTQKRMDALKSKINKLKAKPKGKKRHDEIKKIEGRIENERQTLKATKNRLKQNDENAHRLKGELRFIKNYLQGRV